MALMKRKSLFDLEPTFSSLLESFFGREFDYNFSFLRKGTCVPAVNITEDKESFKIDVAAPRLKKDDIKIKLEENVLEVSSEKEEEKKKNFTRREFSFTSFERRFSLPENINTDKIDASYKDGILKITLPKKEVKVEKQEKEIQIN